MFEVCVFIKDKIIVFFFSSQPIRPRLPTCLRKTP